MVSQFRVSHANIAIILGLLGLGSSTATAQIVVKLDQESDVTGLWNDNSCHYTDNPDELWVYGCPVNAPSSEVDSSSGYWSLCLPKTTSCDMTFDAGFLPKAKTLRLRAFVQGSTNRITIAGKHSSNDILPIYLHAVSTENEDPQWVDVEVPIDQALAKLSAFTITLNSQRGNGYILLDSVSVELEDETTLVTLDKKPDELQSHWIRDTCNYVDDHKDFKYYGCPVEVTETGENAIGFWAPCGYVSCKLEFYSGHGIKPKSLSVHAYFNGTGEIRVSSKLNPNSRSGDTHLVKILTAGNAKAGWVDTVVDLNEYPDHNVAVVELVGSSSNVALIDRITVNVFGESTATVPGEITAPTGDGSTASTVSDGLTDSTTSTVSGPSGPTEGASSTESTPDPNNSGVASIYTCSFFIGMICLALSSIAARY